MSRRVQTLLDRELDNGHLSPGEHESQGYPGTMVETPRWINTAGKTSSIEKIDYLHGEIGTPLCGIFNSVQFRGESVKVVNSIVYFSGIDEGPFSIPVC
jgi:hypothetical protein